MATIHSLNQSISTMPRTVLMPLIHAIRTQRRLKPERAMRKQKSTPAKVARAPKKTALKQQDLFAFASGLDDSAKAKLAAQLLGMVK